MSTCKHCDKVATHTCGACLAATYCGETCQRADWSVHQQECVGLTAEEQAKFGKTMHEFKEGKLHSGSKHGKVVTDRKQALAIAFSKARKH